MPCRDGQLTAADRVTLKATLDRMIPPVDDLPGAGSMGLGESVERYANRSPAMRSALVAILDALSLDPGIHVSGGFQALKAEQQDEAIRSVEVALTEKFGQFLKLVYVVYYMDPRVQRRIGWETRPPQPLGFELPPFDEAILEKQKQRKPFWRKAPS